MLMAKHPEVPLFSDILELRERTKFYGTYATAALDDDNRMRCSYNVSGTQTGRLSSSQTLWGTGGNLQNIPRSSFRRVFITPPKHVFMHADLSQAETRIVAWLSRNEELIDRFLNDPKFDVHRYTAARRIFGVAEDQVSDEQRQRGKACNHSGNYGITYKKFAYIAQIPEVEAKIILARYQQDRYLQGWWQRTRETLQATRTLVTPKPFERKRVFYGRLDDDTFRVAYNYIPQSAVGDIINDGCVTLDAVLDPEVARVVLQVHDEVDLEVDERHVEEVAEVVRKALSTPLDIHPSLPPLNIPIEITYGPNWFDQPFTVKETKYDK